MTVRELIEQLNDVDQDKEVFLWDDSINNSKSITYIDFGCDPKDRLVII